MSYDGAGNMLASTDGRGNNWNTTYNSWGMKETDVEPATTAYSMASNSTTTYAYDPDGRLVTQARPGGVTQTFDYDTVGNLVDQQAPAPRRRWPRAASRTTRSAGSLTAATSNTSTSGLSNATSESFSYNDRGELLTAGGSAGSTALDYNGDGLPTSRADASGTTTYGYDTNDQLKTVNDALTGTTLSYSYNNMNQVKSINEGTGDIRNFSYDGLHRLTSDQLQTPGGATVSSINYGYDQNNNLTSKNTTGFGGTVNNTYTYDRADRLLTWNNGTNTVNYGYEGRGPRNRCAIGTRGDRDLDPSRQRSGRPSGRRCQRRPIHRSYD
jgi:YD repeat-containing protein